MTATTTTLALAILALTQTGCFTALAATACAASDARCTDALDATLAADILLIGAAAEAASASEGSSEAEEYDYCWEHAYMDGRDPERACDGD